MTDRTTMARVEVPTSVGPETAELIRLLQEKGHCTDEQLQEAVACLQAGRALTKTASPGPSMESPPVHQAAAKPPLKPRQAPRYKHQCRIFFAGGMTEGEGTITDLSKAGCKVHCETTVEIGMTLELSFFMPDHPWPLKVDRAVVRWIQGEVFGVEFLNMKPSQRERLRLFISDLEHTRDR